MHIKLFFAIIITILSSNLNAAAMHFHGRSGTARSLTTVLKSSSDREPDSIILKHHADLSASEKAHRIDTLEKLKTLAALELGRAITNEKRKKAASKFSTYTKMQLNIAKSI